MRIVPALIAVLLFVVSLPAQPSRAQGEPRCFPEAPGITNCIEGRFREYWEQNGGLAIFGYPTSPGGMQQSSQGTFLTQYFERNRFELHPENARPYDVLLGRLGDEQLTQQGRNWVDFPRGRQSANCLYFTETSHAVCDQAAGLGFKSYWERNGLRIPGLSRYQQSLALFGLPLSEPAVETNLAGETVLTQWFERARFEWHPNKPDEFKVLLGLLGNEITTSVVRDGNFEAPVISQGFATAQAGQKLGAWTVEAGSVDLHSQQWRPASGKQSLDLTGERPGTIVQDVATVPRQTYRLRFAMAGNPDRAGVKRMAVAWGDKTIASLSFDATRNTRANLGWVYHEYTVVAEGRRTRLTFGSETGENPYGPMIDDVTLRQMTP